MTHGVRADPWNLYESLDCTKQYWIDNLVARYRDLLGFDEDVAQNDRIKRTCIHIFQAWRGEDILLREGMSKETVITETNNGPVIKKNIHHLNRYVVKRDQEARQILIDLGVFDLSSGV